MTRDKLGQRPDQMFYCTNLAWDVRQILATYAYRWAIECTTQTTAQATTCILVPSRLESVHGCYCSCRNGARNVGPFNTEVMHV